MQSNAASGAEESKLGKMSVKEKGKAIGGTPDEWDKKNIQDLIDSYDKAYPGRLKAMKSDVDVETALSGRTVHGEISKESELRVGFWLPEDLQMVMEQGYPSLWTNKKHAQWFMNNFKIFRRSEKV